MAKKAAEKPAETAKEGQEGRGAKPANGPEFQHGEKQERLISIWKKHSDWSAKQVAEEFQRQTGASVSAPTVGKAKVKALGSGNGGDEAATTAAVTRRRGRPPTLAATPEADGDQVSLDAVRAVRQLVERHGADEVRKILALFSK